MRIRALSVFEGTIYHCHVVDAGDPTRPRLEVDAVLRPGDADAEAGPLLLSVADYMVMVGDQHRARAALTHLDERGRVVDRMGVRYLSFPTWEAHPDTTTIAATTGDSASETATETVTASETVASETVASEAAVSEAAASEAAASEAATDAGHR